MKYGVVILQDILKKYDMNNIAVLITCHNRKNTTLKCLGHLYSIRNDIDVFCVDDNSSDGTAEAIKEQYPSVRLIMGDGSLFWCRGMRKAWVSAREQKDYDFYIWLNDDMELYQNAFDEILECSELFHHKAIVSGLVQESSSLKVIYGGYDEHQRLIEANGSNNAIHHLNGNFVLVPKYVFNKIGYFDEVFHHDIGDVDYGFMARKNNIPVVSTRCYIGRTDEVLKSASLRIRKNGVGIINRFKKLYSPLGAPPPIHFHFIKKHRGVFPAIIYCTYLYVINILPDFLWSPIEKKMYN